MRRPSIFFHPAIVFAFLLGLPVSAFARGGGGGGHGSGGHIGGGARGIRNVSPGVRGYGAGYHGFVGGHPGYAVGYRGARWGYPRYYGWGFPYYGYGLGLGLGLGYGLSAGYGYGGYDYPAYGYTNGMTYAASTTSNTNSVVTASAATTSDSEKSARSQEFVKKGTAAFKSADYDGAVYALRHAVVDDPQNALLTLQLAQALFASGKYEEAAGATQAAMHQLPQEEWGAVVRNYAEFYGNQKDYTRQLRALEKALSVNPSNPGLRFLAGYHYGYLGFLKPSIEQLDRVIQIEPRDEMAKQLRDEMKSRLEKTDSQFPPPPVPGPMTTASWTHSK